MKLFGALTFASFCATFGCGQPASDMYESGPVAAVGSEITRAPLSTEPTWAVMIDGYGGWCSASVLSERWILTASHCLVSFAESAPKLTVSYADTVGTVKEIYRGGARLFTNPDYSSWPLHDVALVYLEGYGLDLTITQQAKLCADARAPWMPGVESAEFFMAGYGLGNNPGIGSTDCDALAGTGKVKRLGAGFTLDQISSVTWA